MPISGTHTVVGALLGAGIVATGFESLNWKKLGTIVFSWFFSPAMAALIAFNIMETVSYFTLDTQRFSYGFRLHFLQLITSTAFLLIFLMVDVLVDK
jgi:phosphate/sulfate permease